jgi:two-component system, NtrC family, sensor kinase
VLTELTVQQRDNLAMIGTLMRGITHNINTPLSAIIGRSEMAQMRIQKLRDKCREQIPVTDEFEKIARDLTLIIENTERVSDILKNVTQKSINEQLDEIRPINLCLLLKDEMSFLEADMTFKHKIEKLCYLDETVPTIHGVYSHFSHSFMHLLDNSIRAMERVEQKKLTITGRYDGPCIVIEFRDNGCGIDESTRAALVHCLNNRAAQSIKNNGGMSHIKKLLEPYRPVFEITSIPGDTNITIRFPA